MDLSTNPGQDSRKDQGSKVWASFVNSKILWEDYG